MQSPILDKAQRSYNFIKGRVAEALIERIFTSLEMEIYPVGFEAKLPRLAQLKSIGRIKPRAIERFEYGPDFIVCRPPRGEEKDHAVYQIEVKFRKDGEILVSELQKYEDPSLFFVFADRSGLYCLQKREVREYQKGLKVVFKNCWALADHPIFDFQPYEKTLISMFENLITATLNNFMDDKKLKSILLGSRKDSDDLKLKKSFTKEPKK